ncbi:MAG TPA: efflux RND transporter permease subunit [Polyangiaceae bacterium]|nr:efflux RND transporter permease subunit [Polyangiaceae bacterium]
MKLTDLFIRRPIIAIVLNLMVLIAGARAIRTIDVRQYPRSQNATINVTTVYVGASASLVKGFITTPLERAIAGADGIDYLQSESQKGVSLIHARLRLDYDPNRALAEISSKIDHVRGDLPPEAQIPIVDIQSAESQFASAYLSFSSDVLQQNQITDYLIRAVQPRLSAVEGVERADILGARTFAMRIWLSPVRMAARGVSPEQVRQALANNNYLAAVGESKGQLVEVNLATNTDLHSVKAFQDLVVRKSGDTVVHLGDVADVALGAEDYDTDIHFTGQTAVFMGLWPLPNANTLDVVGRCRTQFEAIQKELPPEIHAKIAYDATDYIQSALHDVERTLAETLVIVVVVIFLFLGSLRSVLVPLVAIPVSLVGAVFLMQAFGFTLNLLTLLAIVLSVGLVVDDAIVVVENIERHLREGMRPYEAALVGARELVSPIIAMTITLAAVYAPIAFQGGLTGSLFREFALTLAGAVAISGFVALTLSPVMSSRLLHAQVRERGFPRLVDRALEKLKAGYGRALDRALRSRGPIYVAWGVLSAVAVLMYVQSPKELAPTEDQGVVFGVVDTPSNSTLEQLGPSTRAINDMAMSFPEAGFTFQVNTPSGGFWGLGLKPWDERQRTARQLLPLVQSKVGTIPSIQTFAILPPALPGGGRYPVEIVIGSTADTQEVLGFAQQIQQAAAKSGMFAFPPLIDVKIDQPQTEIEIDREKAAQLGIDLRTIGRDLGATTSGDFVNRFDVGGRSYKVIPQLPRLARLTPDELQHVHVTGPSGQLVELGTIASLHDTVEPRSLNRFQQLNSVTISGVAIRPLDQALAFLEGEAAKTLPHGYKVDYTGESRQLRVEGNKFLPLFALAGVLIFLVLAAQFNSFRDPFVILAGSVPLAMFGALTMTALKMPNPNVHFFTDRWTTTLNVYSQVGLVTLVGLISKNGILIVQFANELQRAGHSKIDAVKAAASTRLRPILMVSVATVCGHFPLTLVSGPGAAARNSIGLVLVVGMAIGTVFTLFFVPAIYLLVAREHREQERAMLPAAAAPA